MNLRRIVIESLRRRKTRSLFLIFGLMIAVGTVTALFDITRSMHSAIATQLDEFGANIIIVPKTDNLSMNYGGISVSNISISQKELRSSDAESVKTIQNSDNISIVSPKLLHSAQIKGIGVLVVGVAFSEEIRLKKWWTIIGSIPVDRSDVIIGSEVKRKLDLGLGGGVTLNGGEYRVSGILEETGSQDDDLIFISLEEAQRMFNQPGIISLIEVAALCYNCPIEEIVRQTSEKLPGTRVTAISQQIETKMETMHNFEKFSMGISIVILIIGSMIVFTNLTASVHERTREIGLFRAIGFRQSHILKIILMETVIVSGIAGILGYGGGVGLSRLLSPLLGLDMEGLSSVNAIFALLAISLSIAIGITSGIYPALRAARLDPIDALRSL